MDTNRLLLDRCSLVLFLSGSQLFARSKIIRCLFRAWFFLTVIPFTYTFIRFANSGIDSESITFTAFFVATMVQNRFLIMRSTKLECFMERLVNQITESDRKTLVRNVTRIHIVYVSGISILAIVQVCDSLPISDKTSLQIIYDVYYTACNCTTY